MSNEDKVSKGNRQKREALEGGDAQRDTARPKVVARPWGNVHTLPGGAPKIDARRNLPSGPLGGSGRKTNRSRSS